MNKRVSMLLLCMPLCVAQDSSRTRQIQEYARHLYESLHTGLIAYMRCIRCHLEELKVGNTPIPGAIYYIRHRRSGCCRTYQLGKDFTEQEVTSCPHHEKEEVKERLNRCHKVVTFHKGDGTLLAIQPDPILGKRPSLPGGPYASRLKS